MQYYLLWRAPDDGTPNWTGPFTCKLEAMEYPHVQTADVVDGDFIDAILESNIRGGLS